MATKLPYRGSEPVKFKKTKIKKDDEVLVIAGKEKGKKGKVLAIDKRRDRVYIEGVNKRRRYVRPTQENPQGGSIEIEFPIHISNVMFHDAKAENKAKPKKKIKGVRLGFLKKDGKSARVTRPEGKEI
ncbi:50S ribosomal protein L24 [Leptospira ryugenii]|uniref:Large ribosomal subunit protein uL24 n=1 Tax=Leptospira ryugenii TaxID=1917863 RepID=A0A2P2DWB6_9LEPT|nr:50S ribosomal protein L24 [Leptospira ryugenii]GBF48897.1 50S ribosomal protein L24 [Leptospira ryugenii]